MVVLHAVASGSSASDPASGPVYAPALIAGHAIGLTHRLYDDLAARLASYPIRLIRVDLRGHGDSPIPPGPYAMADLAQDLVDTADEHGLDRFSFLGLSLAGAVGQQLALDHPDRLDALVLACTAPAFGGPDPWRERADTVRHNGMGPIVEANTPRWFTEEFRDQHPEAVARVLDELAATDPDGYVACCAALGDFDVSDRLEKIRARTHVITGRRDPGAPPEVMQQYVERIPGTTQTLLDCAHIANVACPEEFAEAVAEHVAGAATP